MRFFVQIFAFTLSLFLCISPASTLPSSRRPGTPARHNFPRFQPRCDIYYSGHIVPDNSFPRKTFYRYTILTEIRAIPPPTPPPLNAGINGAEYAQRTLEVPLLRALSHGQWLSNELNIRGVFRAGDGRLGLQIETSRENWQGFEINNLRALVPIAFRDSHRVLERWARNAFDVEVDQVGEWTGFREAEDLPGIYRVPEK